MKKEDLYDSFENIKPTDKQKLKMLDNILNQEKNFITKKIRRPKVILTALIISLITTSVVADNFSSFMRLLDKINPNIVDFIEPIELISTDQGIEVEVVAVGRYDNMVKAYVTLKDLKDDRIKEDLTFLDYFGIKGARSCGWSMIDYDENEKKATLLVEANSDAKFEGENLTFKIDNIFYNNKVYEDYETNINLTQINLNPNHINATKKQFLSWSPSVSDDEIVPILEPHIDNISFPEVESSMISSIGIIGEKLHVQVWRDKSFEGHGVNMYLKDSHGEKIKASSRFNFGIDKSNNPTNDTDYPSYAEYIFDIDIDKLDEYSLLGYFMTSQQISGNWQVTFKAEDSGNKLELSPNIDLDKIKIEKISINSFGINLSGKMDKDADVYDLDIKVNTKTDVIKASSSSCSYGDDDFSLLAEMEKPIDLDTVESITIDGVIVSFKE
jgi:hypothetical protein